MSTRFIGRYTQGVDEQIAYQITTTNWGASPSSVSVVVKSLPALTNVTATVMPTGSATVVGDVITLPRLKLLTEGVVYRVEVQFTSGGNVFEAYFEVAAEL